MVEPLEVGVEYEVVLVVTGDECDAVVVELLVTDVGELKLALLAACFDSGDAYAVIFMPRVVLVDCGDTKPAAPLVGEPNGDLVGDPCGNRCFSWRRSGEYEVLNLAVELVRIGLPTGVVEREGPPAPGAPVIITMSSANFISPENMRLRRNWRWLLNP